VGQRCRVVECGRVAEAERASKSSTVRWLWERFLRRTPRQERSRALVDAVVDAYEEQLESGKAVSDHALSRLMQRAGVGAGSFYEYFSGGDSLMGALIARLTQKNFDELIGAVDRAEPRSLDEIAAVLSLAVAHAYLDRPRVMRAVVAAIARLGLQAKIVSEHDRFVEELAKRVRPFAPHLPGAQLDRALRVVADASMGLVMAESIRSDRPDIQQVTNDVAAIAKAILGEPPARDQ
jgi:AcrR family transcriptional regulator